jgi:cytochrome b subunit of formate dehydrogenase
VKQRAYYAFILFLIGIAAVVPSLFAAPKELPKPTNEECLACHADASLTKDVDGKQLSLQVKQDAFANSIHGMAFTCVDCHSDIKQSPHETTPAKVNCAQCHADAVQKYDAGFHSKSLHNGGTKAARCADCHGNVHEVVPSSDPKSRVFRTNIPTTCGSCHGQKFVMEGSGISEKPFASYQESVHGKAVAAGSEKAAVCIDCHSSHDIRTAADPHSPINKFNVPLTCAKCHADEKQVFMQSIHGTALARGNTHAPACTDCHGIHLIKKHVDPTSSVAAQNLAKTTCGQCHENARMSDEFGVPGRRSSTYLASYHGLATQMGSPVAANCASCHGVHNIFASTDSRSLTNSARLVETCGKCHPGANENFTKGKIHLDVPLKAENDVGSKVIGFVRKFYLWMIFGTIGFMVLHNLIILRRKLAIHRTGGGAHHPGARILLRMTRNQRIQHFALLVSFITLVLTGFALKYPDSILAAIFWNESIRSIVHRVAGVAMIVAAVYHVFYLGIAREGRRLLVDFLPDIKDASDTVDVFKYYLGLSQKKPQFRRFTYAEKMEYWALVWGTMVMAVTGVMMWAKVFFGNLLPRWFIDVATAVHFYEAVLATLAIIVWHFYQVMFDPDVYPMNWAWLDGKMSVEHYHDEHPLDTVALQGLQEREEPEVTAKEIADESAKEEEKV